MKNLFILIQLLLFLGFGFSSAICGSRPGENKTDSTSISYKTGSTNYVIPRYVIGSGGVIRANGANHWHNATTGQTLVGGMQGTNNLLLSGFWAPVVVFKPPIGVEQSQTEGLPTEFKLHQNYPNPFNPQTTIQYDLPKACRVTVEIFNVVGQRIRLLNSNIQGPGNAQVFWDGRDKQGKIVGSGIYFYRVMASGTKAGKNDASILFQQTKKMLLVK